MPLFNPPPSSGAGSGTVTSVGLSTPGLLDTVSGSPVTAAGTLALALKVQAANKILAGPSTGADAVPTMRALVAGDVGAVNPSALTGSGTVPLAALSGITTSQLDAAAGILSAQIAALATSKLTGTLSASQLAVSSPTSGQIGGLATANLSASAGIVAGQIASVNPSVLTGSGTVPTAGLPAATTSAHGAIQLATTTPVPDTTAGAAGSAGKAADSSHSHATSSGVWLPADHGLLAWNGDVYLTSSSVAPSAAVLYVVRLKIPQALSVTNVVLGINVVGVSLTNCYAGLYDSTGALIGTSADQSTAWTSLGLKTMALTGGPFSVAAGATVWVGFQVGGAGTVPRPATYNTGGSNQADVINANVTGSSARSLGKGTGNAALPGSFTFGSMSVQNTTWWVALS